MLSGSKSDRIIIVLEKEDLLLMTLVLDVFFVVFKEDDDAWYWRDESERDILFCVVVLF